MTDINTLVAWARANSGLISVSGALIIFFSWTITNTLGQRYSRIKAGTESAKAIFRLYTTLHEQRNQLNSLAMEVIQRSGAGNDATIFRAGKTDDPLINEARAQYSRARLSAHQIKELMDFTAEVHALSRAVGRPSPQGDAIEKILEEVDPIYRRLAELDRAAEVAIGNSSLRSSEVMKAVSEFLDYYRLEALPKVPQLYQRIVDASNIRQQEADDFLDLAKRQAGYASRAAMILYVIGSVLALSGQAIEKTKPKDPATPVSIATPTKVAEPVIALPQQKSEPIQQISIAPPKDTSGDHVTYDSENTKK